MRNMSFKDFDYEGYDNKLRNEELKRIRKICGSGPYTNKEHRATFKKSLWQKIKLIFRKA